jgi:hypothetical protein
VATRSIRPAAGFSSGAVGGRGGAEAGGGGAGGGGGQAPYSGEDNQPLYLYACSIYCRVHGSGCSRRSCDVAGADLAESLGDGLCTGEVYVPTGEESVSEQSMHIRDFLKNAREEGRGGLVRVEYRLVCSGTLFPANFLGDWSRSDVARILLQQPVELLVASRPYDGYPQELVLRFVVPLITEQEGNFSRSYYPDQEIASDFAALLTLLCRRLVTVSAKVREQYHDAKIPPILVDNPIPAVTTAKVSYWTLRPLHFLHGLQGVQVRSYHPPPQPFNPVEIGAILSALPQMVVSPAVIRAARLYALAMELIESQSEICYQLFISAVETMASAVLKGWEPDAQAKIASKDGLVSYATQQEGLSREVAERLALQACKQDTWSGKKFKKFLLDNLNREAMGRPDDLFIVPPEYFCPKEDGDIVKALDDVYRTRSSATHSGHSYPASASIGPSATVPFKALDAIFNLERPFPPIGWFERVVNSAICGFLRSQVKQVAAAAAEPD